ncbi:ArsR/SmtB family transcription factor [Actinophytocola sp.]|uniref:ArsR/SmtB family transcription factor n=1 Tax=Actinophytocola sp. TaxID=1872138 RepID=UPI00389AB0A1
MSIGRWAPLSHPDVESVDIDDVLRALADPTRRQIMRLLMTGGDRACGTFGLPVAASTLSHHFRTLRNAGILRQYDDGRQRMNTLRLDELETRFPGLVRTVLDAG